MGLRTIVIWICLHITIFIPYLEVRGAPDLINYGAIKEKLQNQVKDDKLIDKIIVIMKAGDATTDITAINNNPHSTEQWEYIWKMIQDQGGTLTSTQKDVLERFLTMIYNQGWVIKLEQMENLEEIQLLLEHEAEMYEETTDEERIDAWNQMWNILQKISSNTKLTSKQIKMWTIIWQILEEKTTDKEERQMLWKIIWETFQNIQEPDAKQREEWTHTWNLIEKESNTNDEENITTKENTVAHYIFQFIVDQYAQGKNTQRQIQKIDNIQDNMNIQTDTIQFLGWNPITTTTATTNIAHEKETATSEELRTNSEKNNIEFIAWIPKTTTMATTKEDITTSPYTNEETNFIQFIGWDQRTTQTATFSTTIQTSTKLHRQSTIRYIITVLNYCGYIPHMEKDELPQIQQIRDVLRDIHTGTLVSVKQGEKQCNYSFLTQLFNEATKDTYSYPSSSTTTLPTTTTIPTQQQTTRATVQLMWNLLQECGYVADHANLEDVSDDRLRQIISHITDGLIITSNSNPQCNPSYILKLYLSLTTQESTNELGLTPPFTTATTTHTKVSTTLPPQTSQTTGSTTQATAISEETTTVQPSTTTLHSTPLQYLVTILTHCGYIPQTNTEDFSYQRIHEVLQAVQMGALVSSIRDEECNYLFLVRLFQQVSPVQYTSPYSHSYSQEKTTVPTTQTATEQQTTYGHMVTQYIWRILYQCGYIQQFASTPAMSVRDLQAIIRQFVDSPGATVNSDPKCDPQYIVNMYFNLTGQPSTSVTTTPHQNSHTQTTSSTAQPSQAFTTTITPEFYTQTTQTNQRLSPTPTDNTTHTATDQITDGQTTTQFIWRILHECGYVQEFESAPAISVHQLEVIIRQFVASHGVTENSNPHCNPQYIFDLYFNLTGQPPTSTTNTPSLEVTHTQTTYSAALPSQTYTTTITPEIHTQTTQTTQRLTTTQTERTRAETNNLQFVAWQPGATTSSQFTQSTSTMPTTPLLPTTTFTPQTDQQTLLRQLVAYFNYCGYIPQTDNDAFPSIQRIFDVLTHIQLGTLVSVKQGEEQCNYSFLTQLFNEATKDTYSYPSSSTTTLPTTTTIPTQQQTTRATVQLMWILLQECGYVADHANLEDVSDDRLRQIISHITDGLIITSNSNPQCNPSYILKLYLSLTTQESTNELGLTPPFTTATTTHTKVSTTLPPQTSQTTGSTTQATAISEETTTVQPSTTTLHSTPLQYLVTILTHCGYIPQTNTEDFSYQRILEVLQAVQMGALVSSIRDEECNYPFLVRLFQQVSPVHLTTSYSHSYSQEKTTVPTTQTATEQQTTYGYMVTQYIWRILNQCGYIQQFSSTPAMSVRDLQAIIRQFVDSPGATVNSDPKCDPQYIVNMYFNLTGQPSTSVTTTPHQNSHTQTTSSTAQPSQAFTTTITPEFYTQTTQTNQRLSPTPTDNTTHTATDQIRDGQTTTQFIWRILYECGYVQEFESAPAISVHQLEVIIRQFVASHGVTENSNPHCNPQYIFDLYFNLTGQPPTSTTNTPSLEVTHTQTTYSAALPSQTYTTTITPEIHTQTTQTTQRLTTTQTERTRAETNNLQFVAWQPGATTSSQFTQSTSTMPTTPLLPTTTFTPQTDQQTLLRQLVAYFNYCGYIPQTDNDAFPSIQRIFDVLTHIQLGTLVSVKQGEEQCNYSFLTQLFNEATKDTYSYPSSSTTTLPTTTTIPTQQQTTRATVQLMWILLQECGYVADHANLEDVSDDRLRQIISHITDGLIITSNSNPQCNPSYILKLYLSLTTQESTNELGLTPPFTTATTTHTKVSTTLPPQTSQTTGSTTQATAISEETTTVQPSTTTLHSTPLQYLVTILTHCGYIPQTNTEDFSYQRILEVLQAVQMGALVSSIRDEECNYPFLVRLFQQVSPVHLTTSYSHSYSQEKTTVPTTQTATEQQTTYGYMVTQYIWRILNQCGYIQQFSSTPAMSVRDLQAIIRQFVDSPGATVNSDPKCDPQYIVNMYFNLTGQPSTSVTTTPHQNSHTQTTSSTAQPSQAFTTTITPEFYTQTTQTNQRLSPTPTDNTTHTATDQIRDGQTTTQFIWRILYECGYVQEFESAPAISVHQLEVIIRQFVASHGVTENSNPHCNPQYIFDLYFNLTGQPPTSTTNTPSLEVTHTQTTYSAALPSQTYTTTITPEIHTQTTQTTQRLTTTQTERTRAETNNLQFVAWQPGATTSSQFTQSTSTMPTTPLLPTTTFTPQTDQQTLLRQLVAYFNYCGYIPQTDNDAFPSIQRIFDVLTHIQLGTLVSVKQGEEQCNYSFLTQLFNEATKDTYSYPSSSTTTLPTTTTIPTQQQTTRATVQLMWILLQECGYVADHANLEDVSDDRLRQIISHITDGLIITSNSNPQCNPSYILKLYLSLTTQESTNELGLTPPFTTATTTHTKVSTTLPPQTSQTTGSTTQATAISEETTTVQPSTTTLHSTPLQYLVTILTHCGYIPQTNTEDFSYQRILEVLQAVQMGALVSSIRDEECNYPFLVRLFQQVSPVHLTTSYSHSYSQEKTTVPTTQTATEQQTTYGYMVTQYIWRILNQCGYIQQFSSTPAMSVRDLQAIIRQFVDSPGATVNSDPKCDPQYIVNMYFNLTGQPSTSVTTTPHQNSHTQTTSSTAQPSQAFTTTITPEFYTQTTQTNQRLSPTPTDNTTHTATDQIRDGQTTTQFIWRILYECGYVQEFESAPAISVHQLEVIIRQFVASHGVTENSNPHCNPQYIFDLYFNLTGQPPTSTTNTPSLEVTHTQTTYSAALPSQTYTTTITPEIHTQTTQTTQRLTTTQTERTRAETNNLQFVAWQPGATTSSQFTQSTSTMPTTPLLPTTTFTPQTDQQTLLRQLVAYFNYCGYIPQTDNDAFPSIQRIFDVLTHIQLGTLVSVKQGEEQCNYSFLTQLFNEATKDTYSYPSSSTTTLPTTTTIPTQQQTTRATVQLMWILLQECGYVADHANLEDVSDDRLRQIISHITDGLIITSNSNPQCNPSYILKLYLSLTTQESTNELGLTPPFTTATTTHTKVSTTLPPQTSQTTGSTTQATAISEETTTVQPSTTTLHSTPLQYLVTILTHCGYIPQTNTEDFSYQRILEVLQAVQMGALVSSIRDEECNYPFLVRLFQQVSPVHLTTSYSHSYSQEKTTVPTTQTATEQQTTYGYMVTQYIWRILNQCGYIQQFSSTPAMSVRDLQAIIRQFVDSPGATVNSDPKCDPQYIVNMYFNLTGQPSTSVTTTPHQNSHTQTTSSTAQPSQAFTTTITPEFYTQTTQTNQRLSPTPTDNTTHTATDQIRDGQTTTQFIWRILYECGYVQEFESAPAISVHQLEVIIRQFVASHGVTENSNPHCNPQYIFDLYFNLTGQPPTSTTNTPSLEVTHTQTTYSAALPSQTYTTTITPEIHTQTTQTTQRLTTTQTERTRAETNNLQFVAWQPGATTSSQFTQSTSTMPTTPLLPTTTFTPQTDQQTLLRQLVAYFNYCGYIPQTDNDAFPSIQRIFDVLTHIQLGTLVSVKQGEEQCNYSFLTQLFNEATKDTYSYPSSSTTTLPTTTTIPTQQQTTRATVQLMWILLQECGYVADHANLEDVSDDRLRQIISHITDGLIITSNSNPQCNPSYILKLYLSLTTQESTNELGLTPPFTTATTTHTKVSTTLPPQTSQTTGSTTQATAISEETTTVQPSTTTLHSTPLQYLVTILTHCGYIPQTNTEDFSYQRILEVLQAVQMGALVSSIRDEECNYPFLVRLFQQVSPVHLTTSYSHSYSQEKTTVPTTQTATEQQTTYGYMVTQYIWRILNQCGYIQQFSSTPAMSVRDLQAIIRQFVDSPGATVNSDPKCDPQYIVNMYFNLTGQPSTSVTTTPHQNSHTQTTSSTAQPSQAFTTTITPEFYTQTSQTNQRLSPTPTDNTTHTATDRIRDGQTTTQFIWRILYECGYVQEFESAPAISVHQLEVIIRQFVASHGVTENSNPHCNPQYIFDLYFNLTGQPPTSTTNTPSLEVTHTQTTYSAALPSQTYTTTITPEIHTQTTQTTQRLTTTQTERTRAETNNLQFVAWQPGATTSSQFTQSTSTMPTTPLLPTTTFTPQTDQQTLLRQLVAYFNYCGYIPQTDNDAFPSIQRIFDVLTHIQLGTLVSVKQGEEQCNYSFLTQLFNEATKDTYSYPSSSTTTLPTTTTIPTQQQTTRATVQLMWILLQECGYVADHANLEDVSDDRLRQIISHITDGLIITSNSNPQCNPSYILKLYLSLTTQESTNELGLTPPFTTATTTHTKVSTTLPPQTSQTTGSTTQATAISEETTTVQPSTTTLHSTPLQYLVTILTHCGYIPQTNTEDFSYQRILEVLQAVQMGALVSSIRDEECNYPFLVRLFQQVSPVHLTTSYSHPYSQEKTTVPTTQTATEQQTTYGYMVTQYIWRILNQCGYIQQFSSTPAMSVRDLQAIIRQFVDSPGATVNSDPKCDPQYIVNMYFNLTGQPSTSVTTTPHQNSHTQTTSSTAQPSQAFTTTITPEFYTQTSQTNQRLSPTPTDNTTHTATDRIRDGQTTTQFIWRILYECGYVQEFESAPAISVHQLEVIIRQFVASHGVTENSNPHCNPQYIFDLYFNLTGQPPTSTTNTPSLEVTHTQTTYSAALPSQTYTTTITPEIHTQTTQTTQRLTTTQTERTRAETNNLQFVAWQPGATTSSQFTQSTSTMPTTPLLPTTTFTPQTDQQTLLRQLVAYFNYCGYIPQTDNDAFPSIQRIFDVLTHIQLGTLVSVKQGEEQCNYSFLTQLFNEATKDTYSYPSSSTTTLPTTTTIPTQQQTTRATVQLMWILLQECGYVADHANLEDVSDDRLRQIISHITDGLIITSNSNPQCNPSYILKLYLSLTTQESTNELGLTPPFTTATTTHTKVSTTLPPQTSQTTGSTTQATATSEETTTVQPSTTTLHSTPLQYLVTILTHCGYIPQTNTEDFSYQRILEVLQAVQMGALVSSIRDEECNYPFLVRLFQQVSPVHLTTSYSHSYSQEKTTVPTTQTATEQQTTYGHMVTQYIWRILYQCGYIQQFSSTPAMSVRDLQAIIRQFVDSPGTTVNSDPKCDPQYIVNMYFNLTGQPSTSVTTTPHQNSHTQTTSSTAQPSQAFTTTITPEFYTQTTQTNQRLSPTPTDNTTHTATDQIRDGQTTTQFIWRILYECGYVQEFESAPAISVHQLEVIIRQFVASHGVTENSKPHCNPQYIFDLYFILTGQPPTSTTNTPSLEVTHTQTTYSAALPSQTYTTTIIPEIHTQTTQTTQRLTTTQTERTRAETNNLQFVAWQPGATTSSQFTQSTSTMPTTPLLPTTTFTPQTDQQTLLRQLVAYFNYCGYIPQTDNDAFPSIQRIFDVLTHIQLGTLVSVKQGEEQCNYSFLTQLFNEATKDTYSYPSSSTTTLPTTTTIPTQQQTTRATVQLMWILLQECGYVADHANLEDVSDDRLRQIISHITDGLIITSNSNPQCNPSYILKLYLSLTTQESTKELELTPPFTTATTTHTKVSTTLPPQTSQTTGSTTQATAISEETTTVQPSTTTLHSTPLQYLVTILTHCGYIPQTNTEDFSYQRILEVLQAVQMGALVSSIRDEECNYPFLVRLFQQVSPVHLTSSYSHSYSQEKTTVPTTQTATEQQTTYGHMVTQYIWRILYQCGYIQQFSSTPAMSVRDLQAIIRQFVDTPGTTVNSDPKCDPQYIVNMYFNLTGQPSTSVTTTPHQNSHTQTTSSTAQPSQAFTTTITPEFYTETTQTNQRLSPTPTDNTTHTATDQIRDGQTTTQFIWRILYECGYVQEFESAPAISVHQLEVIIRQFVASHGVTENSNPHCNPQYIFDLYFNLTGQPPTSTTNTPSLEVTHTQTTYSAALPSQTYTTTIIPEIHTQTTQTTQRLTTTQTERTRAETNNLQFMAWQPGATTSSQFTQPTSSMTTTPLLPTTTFTAQTDQQTLLRQLVAYFNYCGYIPQTDNDAFPSIQRIFDVLTHIQLGTLVSVKQGEEQCNYRFLTQLFNEATKDIYSYPSSSTTTLPTTTTIPTQQQTTRATVLLLWNLLQDCGYVADHANLEDVSDDRLRQIISHITDGLIITSNSNPQCSPSYIIKLYISLTTQESMIVSQLPTTIMSESVPSIISTLSRSIPSITSSPLLLSTQSRMLENIPDIEYHVEKNSSENPKNTDFYAFTREEIKGAESETETVTVPGSLTDPFHKITVKPVSIVESSVSQEKSVTVTEHPVTTVDNFAERKVKCSCDTSSSDIVSIDSVPESGMSNYPGYALVPLSYLYQLFNALKEKSSKCPNVPMNVVPPHTVISYLIPTPQSKPCENCDDVSNNTVKSFPIVPTLCINCAANPDDSSHQCGCGCSKQAVPCSHGCASGDHQEEIEHNTHHVQHKKIEDSSSSRLGSAPQHKIDYSQSSLSSVFKSWTRGPNPPNAL
ncbi:mucin-3B-like [Periplaneta americana]|uniref:mucin-3B-like n=1 Tax=Periplaneta americana TaxID=6978 RepID=UPI0037E8A485